MVEERMGGAGWVAIRSVMARRCLVAWAIRALVTVVALAFPRSAPADTPLPAASAPAGTGTYKEHFEAAKKLFASKTFDAAAVEFEAAYALSPKPDALRQELECYKQLHAAAKQTTVAKRLLEQPSLLQAREQKKLEGLIASLAPQVGTLVVSSAEVGAAVTIDGRDAGSTPLARPFDVDPGSHRIAITKAGFEPFEKEVAIAGQATVTVDATMEHEITTGKVTVLEASGATVDVLVDGKPVGPTPWTGDLPLGEHEIAGLSPTLAAPAQTIDVLKKKPIELSLGGLTLLGTIDVAIAGGMGVLYLDGKVVGEGNAKFDVPVGRHTVSVRREGFNTAEGPIDVRAGQVLPVKIALQPRAPAPPPPSAAPRDVYQAGAYGGLTFAALLQANSTGSQLDRRCTDVATSCTGALDRGGGIYGFAGYTWRPVGVDVFFGGSADSSTPSAGAPVFQSWGISRLQGLAALRVRGRLETRLVRASLAAGLGVAEAFVFSLSTGKPSTETLGGQTVSLPAAPSFKSSEYTSLVGTFDLAFSLRSSATNALAIGVMGIFENAGQNATVDISSSRTPFWLFSGPQVLIEPYFGFQFGR